MKGSRPGHPQKRLSHEIKGGINFADVMGSPKTIRRFVLGVLSLLVVMLWSAPAWGQFIDLDALWSRRSGVQTYRVGNVEIAPIRLDGRFLFRVAAPAPDVPDPDFRPIQWRVQELNFKFRSLIVNRFDPETLTVFVANVDNQPVIQVQDQQMESPKTLLTVTPLDVQIDVSGNTATQVAQRRAEIIETALLNAWQERQPDYLRRQLRRIALMLLVMGVGFALTVGLQRWRHQRSRQMLEVHQRAEALAANSDQGATSTLQDEASVAEPDPRPTRLNRFSLTWNQWKLLNQMTKILLQVLQVGIVFGGIVWMLRQLPYTRGFSNWLLTLPLSLILIPLVLALVRWGVDWSILFSLNRWANWANDTQAANHRVRLRANTIWEVTQWVTLGLAYVIGILLFFVVINALPIGLIILAVFGLASQNLVKDWLRGIVILLEDHYAQGDIVTIDGVTGIVETMNLRVTQLRTLDRHLVSIDNGSFSKAINLTSTQSGIALSITVAYSTDLDQAIAVIAQVGQEMRQVPDWHDIMLEDPEVLGVDDFGDNGVAIRLVIKTVPGKHASTGREFRRRLKPALDQAGITIPLPQRSVWLADARSA
jgi:small-conductance mechanosensitive channel